MTEDIEFQVAKAQNAIGPWNGLPTSESMTHPGIKHFEHRRLLYPVVGPVREGLGEVFARGHSAENNERNLGRHASEFGDDGETWVSAKHRLD